jgi:phospholipid-binding lipoprotein MlaA
MKKNVFSLIISIGFLILLFTPAPYAQDSKSLAPILSNVELEEGLSRPLKPATFYLAQNSQANDDEFDEELIGASEEAVAEADVADPLYYFNYLMYGINDILYFAAVKPVAQGYKAIVPTPVRKGIRNFFHNLLFPVRFVNNLFQGKFSKAGTEVEIFLINSTAGVLGFSQVAQNHYDMHTSNEDLGQTFGSYDIGEGFYLFIPLIGPTTLRDSVGMVGDYFLTPINYAEPWELYWGLKGTDGVNTMSFHIGDYESIKEAAIDPYAALKNAYIQNRNKKIQD